MFCFMWPQYSFLLCEPFSLWLARTNYPGTYGHYAIQVTTGYLPWASLGTHLSINMNEKVEQLCRLVTDCLG